MSRQTFDLIDSDGSGTLETGELEEWFRMCGAELDLSTLLEVLVGGQVSSHSCQTLVLSTTITEKAPIRVFSWLKAPTSTLNRPMVSRHEIEAPTQRSFWDWQVG